MKLPTTTGQTPVVLEGSGGGGGSRQATRTPDSLFSQDFVEIVFGVAEGPIQGLKWGDSGPLENFFIGETQLQNSSTGEANFSDFKVTERRGADGDPPIERVLGGDSSNLVVGVSLAQNTPVVRTTPSITRKTVDGTGINRLEVRLLFQQLFRTDDKGDYEHTAHFKIEYKASNSGTWILYNGEADSTITGKTTSGAVKDFLIDVTPLTNADYDIRVTKLSPDASTTEFVEITWESVQMVTLGNHQYPGLASLHVYARVTDQFSSLPDMSGVYEGMLIDVPTNYNPGARTYDETTPWNGTFKKAFTSNPAWILYCLLMSTEHGLARYYKGVTTNRYEFYSAAKWCDDPVSSAVIGVTQPRFTFNELIDSRRLGMETLQYLAGSFNSVLYDSADGLIRLRTDQYRTPKQIFVPENVSDNNSFQYSKTDIANRYNDVTVRFVNPELGWKEDQRKASIDATEWQDKNGLIPLDFVAVGCTDAHEAVRRANDRLLTANTEVTTVSFATNRLGLLVELYDIIYIADPTSGWSTGGRIKSMGAGVIQLRDPIYFAEVTSAVIRIQTYTGLVDLTVVPTAPGLNYSLTVTSGAIPTNVPDRTAFTVQDGVNFGFCKPFRVMSISDVDGSPDSFRVNAIEINANKYTDSANGTVSDEIIYDAGTPGEPRLPASLNLENVPPLITSDGSLTYRIKASWERPFQAFTDRYEIDYMEVGTGSWTTVTTYADEIYLQPVRDGAFYHVRLFAIAPTGKRSRKSLEITSFEVETKDANLQNVLGLSVLKTTLGWQVSWSRPTEIPDYDGVDLRTGTTSQTWATVAARFRAYNTEQTLPWLSAGITRVFAKYNDTSNNESTTAQTVDITVAVPNTISLVGTPNISTGAVEFQYADPTSSQPLRRVLFKVGTASSTWTTATDAGAAGSDARNHTLIFNTDGDKRVFIRAEDMAGNLGGDFYVDLNINRETSILDIIGPIDVGTVADNSITASKLALNIEPVTIIAAGLPLPTTKITSFILHNDGLLYRWDPVSASYKNISQLAQMAGQVTSAQIADLAASKIVGQLVASQLADNSVTMAKLFAGLEPPVTVTTLPTTRVSSTVFFSGRLYHWNGTAYVKDFPAADITGVLTNDQLQDIAATKITGQLVTAQLSDGAISAAKVASGLELVANSSAGSLPTTFLGNLLRWNQKLYRWTGSAYTAAVPAADVSGQLTNAQIADVAATKLTGQVVATQIADGVISAAKISAGLELVANSSAGSLPTSYLGELLRWSGKLYRWTGSAYTSAVPAADVSGQLTNAQLQDIAAAKVTGQLVDSQLAQISASKLSGLVTDAQIQALGAAKVTGQITGTQISDNAITTPKISAGAVVANSIAAGSIIASKLTLTDGDSVFPDPLFSDPAWWANDIGGGAWPTGFNSLADTSWPCRNAVRIGPTTSGFKVTQSAGFAIEPEATYRFKLYVFMTSDFAGEVAFNVHFPNVTWYAVNGLPISGLMTGDNLPKINNAAITRNTWVTFEGSFTNPAFNGTNNIANLRISAQTTAGYVYFALRMVRAANASLILDGAILADKLAANSVTAGKINANAVTAGTIAAGAVTAGTIAANAVTAGTIAANAITATNIVAGSISADRITANSLTAAQIATGAITADKIVAGAVVASKLTITDLTNFAENPTFELGDVGWPTKEGNWQIVSGQGERGGWVARADAGATGAIRNGFLFRADANTQIYVSARVRASNGLANQVGIRVTAQRSTFPFEIEVGAVYNVAGSGSVWQDLYFGGLGYNLTLPSDYDTFRVELLSNCSSGFVLVDSVTVNRKNNSNLIVDGGIVTGHMTANSISGDRISANTLNASKIVAGSITTDRMTANTIHGDRISGGTIAADKIVADSITSAQIAAGAITASEVAAGAITTSKLFLVPAGYNPDPTFKDTPAWALDTGWTFDTGEATMLGKRSIILWQGNYAGNARRHTFGNVLTGAPAGKKVRIRCFGYNFTNQNIYAQVSFYSETAAYVGAVQVMLAPSGGNTPANFSALGDVPTNAATYQFVVFNEAPGSNLSGYTRITDVQMEIAASAELIVDGAITADKIAANAITAVKISAGTITGDKIAGETITGNLIQGGTITGSKLVAGTITASLIAAGAITANKLLVAPSNICPDPSFSDPAYWDFVSSGGNPSYNWYYEESAELGSRGAAIWGGATGPTTETVVRYSQRLKFNNAGMQVRLRARCRNVSNRSVSVYAEFFGNSDSDFKGNFAVTFPAGSGVTTQTSAPFTVPAGTTRIGFLLYAQGGTALDGAAVVSDINCVFASTADMVVDGAITADKLAVNSVTAGKILAGTITGDKIAANTITTSKLVIIPQSLNPDPSFNDLAFWKEGSGFWRDYGTSGWYVEGVVSGEGYMGRNITLFAGQAVPPGTGRKEVYSSLINFDGQGQVLRLRARGINLSNQYMNVDLQFYDASNTLFSGTSIQWAAGSGNASNRSAQVVVPNFTAKLRLVVYNEGGTALTGYMRAAEIIVEVAASSELIVDGSILAGKIAADAVVAGKVAAGAINAREIAAGAITASKIVVSNRDSVDPDPSFYDGLFWNNEAVGGSAASTVGVGFPSFMVGETSADTWSSRRLKVGPSGGDFDTRSRYFDTEPGASYRARLTFLVSEDFVGEFGVWAHVPNQVWWAFGRDAGNAVVGLSGFNKSVRNAWITSTSILTLATGPDRRNMQLRMAGNITAGNVYFALQILRASDGQLIVDGAITADKISANAITAVKIAAGTITGDKIAANTINADRIVSQSITADRLSLGVRGNNGVTQVRNSDFTEYTGRSDTDDPLAFPSWTAANHAGVAGRIFGRNYEGGAAWNIGSGGLWLRDTSTTSVEWGFTQTIPVNAGWNYELHCKGSAHRCMARMVGFWKNAANEVISSFGINADAGTGGINTTDAGQLSYLMWGSAIAPTGATAMGLYLLKRETQAGGDSYAFFNEIYVAPFIAGAAASNPSMYRTPGMVQIHGGGIRAETIDAASIKTSTITTDRLVVGAVTSVAAATGNLSSGSYSSETTLLSTTIDTGGFGLYIHCFGSAASSASCTVQFILKINGTAVLTVARGSFISDGSLVAILNQPYYNNNPGSGTLTVSLTAQVTFGSVTSLFAGSIFLLSTKR